MPPPDTREPAESAGPRDAPRIATLDARGLLCPLPVLLTAREIAKLSPGGLLVIEGDDRGMLEDLPAWCEASGHRLVEIGELAAGGERASAARRGTRPVIRAVVEKTR